MLLQVIASAIGSFRNSLVFLVSNAKIGWKRDMMKTKPSEGQQLSLGYPHL
jgi:hypothetical protein